MSDYILLLRGGLTASQQSSVQEQELNLQKYREWAMNLQSQDCLKDAAKLDDDGRKLVQTSTGIEIDGPFTETHEIIGGYYLIHADSIQEATQLAQKCPIFLEGGTVEIREIQR